MELVRQMTVQSQKFFEEVEFLFFPGIVKERLRLSLV